MSRTWQHDRRPLEDGKQGEAQSAPSAIIFLALLSVVFINPLYVNVSSLYSGSAFLLALTLFTVTRIQAVTYDHRSDIFIGIVVALFYSSLVALKGTFLFFIALHFVFLIAAIGLATRDTRRTMRIALTVVPVSIFFISPWLSLYLPHYLEGVHNVFTSSASLPTLTSVLGRPIDIDLPPIINLLSTDPVFYGDSFAKYTFAVCLVVYCGMFVLVGARTQNAALKEKAPVFVGTCVAVFATYIVFMFVAAPKLPGASSGPETWLRYFCPILIGTLPAAVLIAGHYHADKSSLAGQPRLITGLLVLPMLILLWTFSSSLNDRVRQAYNYGSILAFPFAKSQNYLTYNNSVLNGQMHSYTERLQDMVPPNERLIAWISTPLHLNYARNRILDVNTAGLASPWVILPDVLNYSEIKRYFQSLHVNYILWERNGFGIQHPQQYLEFAASPSAYDRRSGINSLYFGKMLAIISQHRSDVSNRFDNIIFDDGSTALLRLND